MTIASLTLLCAVLLVAAMNWPEMREAWRKTGKENLERVLGGAGGEPGPGSPAPVPSSTLTRPGASNPGVEPRALPPEAPGSVSDPYALWWLLHGRLP